MRVFAMMKMGCAALRANLFNQRIPLNVMLSVTNRCTAHCSYCDIPSRSKKEMRTQEVFGLIDEITALGCQRLGLWGGEPLLREDIGEIIAYAKSKGLFVTLDSNGHLVAKRRRALACLDHLVLALDGNEREHDLNRGEGSFQKVMSAIESVKGDIPLWTITVLTKHNVDSIDFVLRQAKEHGFLTTFQALHHNEVLGRNHDALLPASHEYRRAFSRLLQEKKKGAPIVSSHAYLAHALRWDDYRKVMGTMPSGGFRCWAGKLYCNVDADGGVYPCSLLVEKTKATNFLESGFKQAFDNLTTGGCVSCLASCFTEYNRLYSLDLGTMSEWMLAMARTQYAKRRIKKYH